MKGTNNGGCEPSTTMDQEYNLGDHCPQTSGSKADDSAKELGEKNFLQTQS